MSPKRIQMSRQHPWRADNPDAVIVARPSEWGNRFRIGNRYMVFKELGWGMRTELVKGQEFGPLAEVVECSDRTTATNLFRAWMKTYLTTAARKADLSPLAGRDLACWCPLDQPCHADVLLELANEKETP